MRTQRQISVSVPIPINVPPLAVLTTLHSITPIVRHLGFILRYERVPIPPEIAEDPWFIAPYEHSCYCYRITQHVAMAPGINKEVTYTTILQRVGDKVRGRAHAPVNIVIRSEFSVRPKQAMSPASESTSSTATVEPEEYEFHEEAYLEANSLLMPFISQTMILAHQQLCTRVVDEAVKTYFAGFQ